MFFGKTINLFPLFPGEKKEKEILKKNFYQKIRRDLDALSNSSMIDCELILYLSSIKFKTWINFTHFIVTADSSILIHKSWAFQFNTL